MNTDAADRRIALNEMCVGSRHHQSSISQHTVDIPNDVAGYPVREIEIDQAVLFHKRRMGAENDLPGISPWKLLALLKPVDHA